MHARLAASRDRPLDLREVGENHGDEAERRRHGLHEKDPARHGQAAVDAGAHDAAQQEQLEVGSTRTTITVATMSIESPAGPLPGLSARSGSGGGDEGTRTPDPCDANAVLFQLSYIPTGVEF